MSPNFDLEDNKKSKKKVILKGPMCIYSKVDLFIYYPSLDIIPD